MSDVGGARFDLRGNLQKGLELEEGNVGSTLGVFFLKVIVMVFFWAVFGFIFSATKLRHWTWATSDEQEYTYLESKDTKTQKDLQRMAEIEEMEEYDLDAKLGIGNGLWFSLVTWSTVGYGDAAPISTTTRTLVSLEIAIMLLAGLFF